MVPAPEPSRPFAERAPRQEGFALTAESRRTQAALAALIGTNVLFAAVNLVTGLGHDPRVARAALPPPPPASPTIDVPMVATAPDLELASFHDAPTTTSPPPAGHHAAGVASWFAFTKGTCASRTIPRGTVVTVTRPATGASVTCKVADWGPGDTNRIIDLSPDVFAALSNPGTGLLDVRLAW
ncbi:MAG: septal ring lytic transglycosylase RlpA family protein [Acidimicrobiales bacterium]